MTIWQIMNGDCGYAMANRYFFPHDFLKQWINNDRQPNSTQETTYSARRDAMRILSSLRYRSFT